MSLEMQNVTLNKISQRAIDDAGADALCIAVSDILMAWGHLKRETPSLAPLTLADIDRIVDKCIEASALRDLDKDGQSDGFVSSHEKIAGVVGLKGFTKVREPYDKHFEKAKAETKRQQIAIDLQLAYTDYNELLHFCDAVRNEAAAFRDLIHAAGEKESGKTIPKILFSWEE